jgi:hypothetical protein
MGILGLFIPYIGSLLAVTAIVLGIVSLRKIKRNPALTGKGFAIAGLVLGIIGLILIIVTFILGFGGGGLGGGGVMTPQFQTVQVHPAQ